MPRNMGPAAITPSISDSYFWAPRTSSTGAILSPNVRQAAEPKGRETDLLESKNLVVSPARSQRPADAREVCRFERLLDPDRMIDESFVAPPDRENTVRLYVTKGFPCPRVCPAVCGA